MNQYPHLTRRNFLRTAGAAAAAAVPCLVPASVRGANAPSNRITVASIGTGNQGFNDLRAFLKLDDAQVVAVCDVNRASFGYRDDTQFYGREPVAPVEVGHRSASVCHLGNIAVRLGKRKVLQWDPVAERFTNDDDANAMLSRPLRGGWEV